MRCVNARVSAMDKRSSILPRVLPKSMQSVPQNPPLRGTGAGALVLQPRPSLVKSSFWGTNSRHF